MEEERISSSYGHRVDKLFNLSIRNVWSQIIIFFFSFLFLGLISTFMSLWSEKMPDIVSTLFNLFT